MKVYGWNPYGSGTRHIAAAATKKAIAELVGASVRSSALFGLEETANADEVDVATSRPGEEFTQRKDGSWANRKDEQAKREADQKTALAELGKARRKALKKLKVAREALDEFTNFSRAGGLGSCCIASGGSPDGTLDHIDALLIYLEQDVELAKKDPSLNSDETRKEMGRRRMERTGKGDYR